MGGRKDVVFHVENGDVLDMTNHSNRTKYPNQKIMFLKMRDYVFMVPYVSSLIHKYVTEQVKDI